ncbi:MAG: cytochrome c oxidase assembly protein [Rhodospirillales bacterium]
MTGASAPVKNLRMAALLFGLTGGMVGLSFASVPFYQWFCQVTGYGGAPRTDDVAAAPGAKAGAVPVTVTFDANTNGIAWSFQPVQAAMTVRPGEQTLAFYRARNLSDKTVTGTATFNVSPAKAGLYFAKIDCFCFTEQTLGPGESADMPVSFFIDPEMLEDSSTHEVRTLTLSYTFFETEPEPETPQRQDG